MSDNRVVWKYQLAMDDDYTSVLMPAGAIPLNVQTQGQQPCLWALCDPERELVAQWFRFAGTGHPISQRESNHYVDTFQMMGGGLIFHLFLLDGPPEWRR